MPACPSAERGDASAYRSVSCRRHQAAHLPTPIRCQSGRSGTSCSCREAYGVMSPLRYPKHPLILQRHLVADLPPGTLTLSWVLGFQTECRLAGVTPECMCPALLRVADILVLDRVRLRL